MDQSSDLQGYLKSVPTTDDVRADTWDAFNGAKDQNDFQTKVSRLPIPDDAKADLWDAKYGGKPISVYKNATKPQVGEVGQLHPTPQVNPSSPAPDQPGVIKRAAQGLNLPTTGREALHMLGPEGGLAGMAWNYGKNLYSEAKNTAKESYEARENIRNGGSVADNLIGKVGSAGLELINRGLLGPFGGNALQNMGEDAAAKNYRGMVGDAIGGLGTAALMGKGGEKAVEKPTEAPKPTGVSGQARAAQALGTGPGQATLRTVHVSPEMADAIDAHGADGNLQGQRYIVKTTKTGKQTMTLADRNPDTGSFNYQNFRDADGKPTLDNSIQAQPGKNTVPVNLSTVNGNRGTAAPGHFLTAETDRLAAKSGTVPATAPSAEAQATAQAPAAVSPTPSLPEAPATPPTPLPVAETPKPVETPVDSKALIAYKNRPKTGVATTAQQSKLLDAQTNLRALEQQAPLHDISDPDFSDKLEQAKIDVHVAEGNPSTPAAKVIDAGKIVTKSKTLDGGVKPGTILPPDLSKSAPRYGYQGKNFQLQFESPQDLALYTITQTVKNSAHDRFMDYLHQQFPGTPDAALVKRGKAVRDTIKSMARNGDPTDGPLTIGKHQWTAEPTTPTAQTPAATPDVLNPAERTVHEAAMRPVIGETIRLAQLRRGELASHAIDIAMRESRDPAGKIPTDVASTLSEALGEKVGDTLTPSQMTRVESLRGAKLGTEPSLKIFSKAQAEKMRSEGYVGKDGNKIAPDDVDEAFFNSQVKALELLHDPTISDKLKSQLTDVIQNNKPFHLSDLNIQYPKPYDLASDHPEYPFAPKALGHEITPITMDNYTAALGKRPHDLFLGSNSGTRYLSPEDIAEFEAMKRGTEPGQTPLSSNPLEKSQQLTELLGTDKNDPEASSGMQQGTIDNVMHEGSDVAEHYRGLKQKVLDSRQARTLGVLKGQIGMLKKLGGPSEQLQAQLDALSPDVKALLPKELFNEKSLETPATPTGKTPDNAQPVTPASATPIPTKNASAGKPTRYEGIKTTGIEAQILEKYPERAKDIDTIQKGVVDRFPEVKTRQKAYAGAIAQYAKRFEAGDPYALKQGIDAANRKPTNVDTTSGMGLGGAQSLIPQRIKAYSPGEVQAIAYSAADRMLERWENMTNAELAKKKSGLWKDSLVNAIDQAKPTATDPEEYQVQKELHDELVARHSALKQLAGPSINMLDRLMDMAMDMASKDRAGQLLRETGGTMDRNNAIIRNHFNQMDKFMNQLSEPERYRFWDNMTRGDAQIEDPISSDKVMQWQAKNGPVMNPNDVARSIRSVLDAARDRVIDTSGNLKNFFTDYMPGLWDNSAKGKSFTDNWVGNQNFQGSSQFLKQKIYQYYNDALDAGLQPTTTNPVRGAMMITEQLNRYSMAHDFKNRLVDENMATFYGRDEAPPAGWEQLDDRLFQTGTGGYWGPKGVARTFNNFTSTGFKGAWKVPYTDFSMYDALRSTNNLANRMQLGMSLFHGMETTLNSGFTTMAVGLKQIVNEGKIVSGITNTIKGGTLITPLVEDVWNGSKGLVNFRDPTKALDYAQLGSDLEAARANIDEPRFKMEQIQRLKENFKVAADSLEAPMTRAKAAGKAAMNLLGSTVETAAYPIMNYLVPRVKIGAFYKMAQQIHSEYAGSPPDVINLELQKAWDSVDNRFGQISYQNLNINKMTQDALALVVRSPGWNIGTLREVGLGATKDIASTFADAAQGKGFKITNRTAYTGALVMGTMMINAIYQSMHPAAPPVKGIDYFFPQDGTKTVNGEANRVYPKDYVYDFINAYHDPFGTAWHKGAPDISTLSDIIHNEDYYHREIRDPGSSGTDQAKATLGFLANQFVPFSVKNFQESQLRNQTGKIEPFAGILPAPRWVGRTRAENLAFDYFNQKGSSSDSAAQLERKRTFVELRNKVADGTITPDMVQSAMDAGKLSPESVGYLYQTLNKPQIVNWTEHLYDPDKVWNVWKTATTEEKKVLLPTVESKITKELSGKEQEDKLQELNDFQAKFDQ